MWNRRISVWEEKRFLDYVLIMLVSLHTLLWFREGTLYFQGDTGIPYNPIKNLNLLYFWWEQQGGIESWGFSQTFYLLFFVLLEKLNINLIISQDIYIYLTRVIAGCAMYYLSAALTKNRFVCLSSAFIYLFSPFQLGLIFIYVYLPYVFMPLILGLYIKGLHNKSKVHLFLSSAALISLSCDFPNYRHYLVTVNLMLLYSLFYILAYFREEKHILRHTLVSLVLVGLFNALLTLWISLPVYNIVSNLTVTGLISNYNVGLDFGDYGWATLLNVIRLRGSASLECGTGAVYADTLVNNPLLIISSFYLPIIAFSAVLFTGRQDKFIYFLLIVSILFLFAAKGTNHPLGSVYEGVVVNIPLARTFRTSWLSILPVVMAYSILASVSINSIYRYLSSKKHKYGYYFLTFSTFIILVSSYPLVTGGYVQSVYSITKSGGYIIPKAYYEIEEYLADKLPPGKRFLKIPKSEGYISTLHAWNYYGANITPFIFSKHSHISSNHIRNSSHTLVDTIYRKAARNEFDKEFEMLLRMFNIKYLLLDGYIENERFDAIAPTFINQLLQNGSFRPVKSFDRLYLIEYIDNSLPEHIRAY